MKEKKPNEKKPLGDEPQSEVGNPAGKETETKEIGANDSNPMESRPKEIRPLCGRRRELTKDLFEELGKFLCEKTEILGYIGATEKKLDRWCRSAYRMPLDEILPMIHQDGKVEIRRITFDAMRKSATLVNQLYNRFLSYPAEDQERAAKDMAKEIFSMMNPEEEEVEELFRE